MYASSHLESHKPLWSGSIIPLFSPAARYSCCARTPKRAHDSLKFFENYACNSQNNVTGYCNPEVEKLFDQRSQEIDLDKRKKMVWEIDKKLQEDGARPIIYHLRGATCWQPQVKGLTIMVNSMYNGWRMEDVWLDK
jgi:ABC-type transport system substrate-binding protein